MTHMGERVYRSDECTRIRVKDLEFHPESHSPTIKCSIRCLLPLKLIFFTQFSSVQLLSGVHSLWPHGLQHARLPCTSPTPRAYSNACPLSQWCHPTISSSVMPFSSCPQSFPASGSFQMSQLFASGGQSIRVSASTSFLPMKSFRSLHIRQTEIKNSGEHRFEIFKQDSRGQSHSLRVLLFLQTLPLTPSTRHRQCSLKSEKSHCGL